MAETTYIYTISTDMPGGDVKPGRLKKECTDDGTVPTPVRVKRSGDQLNVVFDPALTAGQKTAFDGDTTGPAGGLLAAHDNQAYPDSFVEKTTDPTVNDDENVGYEEGYRWLNTTTGVEWACADPSVGAAVWKRATYNKAINLLFTGRDYPYTRTLQDSYQLVGTFRFPGTDAAGVPSYLKVVAYLSNGTDFDIKVIDAGNGGVTVAEVVDQTNASAAIIDMGTLSNLPTGESVFEVCALVTGSGKEVHVLSLEMGW